MARQQLGMDMSLPIDDGLDMYDRAEKKALERVHDTGLELRRHPPRWQDGRYYDGRLPVDLGSMQPREIGEYYGLQVDYTDFVEAQTVLARAEMISARSKLTFVQASVRKTKTGTEQEKLDLATIDSRYVEANAAFIEAQTYFELISAIGEAARRDVKFVSRIIETKKMELEMGGRGGYVGGKTLGQQRFAHKADGNDDVPRRRRSQRTE